MSDLTANCPDNPYNPASRIARDAVRSQRKADCMNTPRPDRLLMQEVARATGVRVIEEARPLYLDYSLPVPCKANDNESFDDAVKRDRNWLAGRNRRTERN
jgi:hypothetical protein